MLSCPYQLKTYLKNMPSNHFVFSHQLCTSYVFGREMTSTLQANAKPMRAHKKKISRTYSQHKKSTNTIVPHYLVPF